MNIQQALDQAHQKLTQSSSSALLDAQVLLTHVLQCNTAHLMAWPEKCLDDKQKNNYQQLIRQRQEGVPVAHLTGKREFWSLDFFVNNRTLIPRPETETLIEYILSNFSDKKQLKLLDMGTGTGAIALAIATEKPDWQITACDLSTDAIELAIKNKHHHQITNVAFIQSNWFKNITATDFDIIVSNPPYIAEGDSHLQEGDVRFEPHSALTSGKTGMDDINYICFHAKEYLATKGCLIFEHGYQQGQDVSDCFTDNGYDKIEQQHDLSGHIRMTAGRKI